MKLLDWLLVVVVLACFYVLVMAVKDIAKTQRELRTNQQQLISDVNSLRLHLIHYEPENPYE